MGRRLPYWENRIRQGTWKHVACCCQWYRICFPEFLKQFWRLDMVICATAETDGVWCQRFRNQEISGAWSSFCDPAEWADKKTYVLLYLYVNCDDDLMKNFVWCSVFRCENCLAWFVQRDLVIEMLASCHCRWFGPPFGVIFGNQLNSTCDSFSLSDNII